MKEIKLSKRQLDLIRKMKDGNFLFENCVTPGAKWLIGKDFSLGRWGNVHGVVVNGIMHLIASEKVNFSVRKYSLNQQGIDMPYPLKNS